MKELIKAKMDDHVRRILSKDTITNDDYMLLGNVLVGVEAEEQREKSSGIDTSFMWLVVIFLMTFIGGDHHGV